MASKPAVVLLSGGLDSATVLALAKSQGFACFALSFQYGQRHAVELDCAKKLADAIGASRHVILPIDLRTFGGSALTGNIPVPKGRSHDDISTGIPITYVPARNTIFLSFALAWAEVLECSDIFAGMNALDYSGYPDCRPEFIDAFQSMANLATKAAVEGTRKVSLHTPLISMTKAQIIRTGLDLGVDYANTNSCYDPSAIGIACGACDSCQLRLKGFKENNTVDPVTYRKTE
jgi:7-cyano-7-deazaguanine synthase